MKRSELSEFAVEEEGFKLKIRRGFNGLPIVSSGRGSSHPFVPGPDTVVPFAPAAAPSPAPATAPAAQAPAAAPAAQPAVPANWYADPAGRFELRYWDGSQWTEHVSRGGQQFTDPPVA